MSNEHNKDLEEIINRSVQLRIENKKLREEIQLLKVKRIGIDATSGIDIKIQGGLFELLVSGKKVMIQQADGTELHFSLEDVSLDQMLRAIYRAQALENIKLFVES